MSQASFDDDELFTEATADIQSEIEESLTAATAALPSHADLVKHDTETAVAALESVEEAVDIDAAEAAVADVKKTFLLSQQRIPSIRNMPLRPKQRSMSCRVTVPSSTSF